MSNPVQIQCAGIRNVTVTNFDVSNLDKSHELGNKSRLERTSNQKLNSGQPVARLFNSITYLKVRDFRLRAFL